MSEVLKLKSEVERLKAELAEAKHALAQCTISPTSTTTTTTSGSTAMNEQINDDNPYSRLIALKRMGIVQNYEQIRTFGVAIVGIGGVGSVTAEMLARCGIGKLILFDLDSVQRANMNRLFYRPEHVGLRKVEAAAVMLHAINPDVSIESVPCDVTKADGFKLLSEAVSKVDLVLSCVDNYEARMSVNQACNEAGKTWIESGVSENAVSGHIQLMVPGRTACFCCCPPLIIASGISEKTLKRDGVCAASLPTTMGLVAALLAQATLKWLLGFGNVSCFVGYNALNDFFPRDVIKPNPDCTNNACRQRQKEMKEKRLDFPPTTTEDTEKKKQKEEAEKQKPVHENNDWGIEIINDTNQEHQKAQEDTKLAEGIEYAFDVATSSEINAQLPPEITVQHTNADISELAAQLAALQSK